MPMLIEVEEGLSGRREEVLEFTFEESFDGFRIQRGKKLSFPKMFEVEGGAVKVKDGFYGLGGGKNHS